MAHPFDPGYCTEPFLTLCREYPGPDVYPPGEFRVEWGPIFHRGRLDGSARVLVIGQDPAQHETVVRRILVGEAGRRVQGFLAKLGIMRSYVIVNTFLYSVYGSVKAATARHADLVAYRNRWLDALVGGGSIEGVITFGTAAREAWRFWRQTPTGATHALPLAALTHPTQPERFSKGNRAKLAAATGALLENWNAGLAALRPAVTHTDVAPSVAPYGTTWGPDDRVSIPHDDVPAGTPAWMVANDGWARRAGEDALAKRRTIVVTVPAGVVPPA